MGRIKLVRKRWFDLDDCYLEVMLRGFHHANLEFWSKLGNFNRDL